MVASSPTLEASPLDLQPTSEEPLSPIVRMRQAVAASLVYSAFGGYVAYWGTRLLTKIKLVNNPLQVPIRPLPYVACGILHVAIVEAALLIHDLARHLLGERQTLTDAQERATSPSLRSHAWKVIENFEKSIEGIDAIFSRLFAIRTAKQLVEANVSDLDFSLFEVIREAFKQQVLETAKETVPKELAISLVQACGYPIIGGRTLLYLYGFVFFAGLYEKVNIIWQKQDAALQELLSQQQESNSLANVDEAHSQTKLEIEPINEEGDVMPDPDSIALEQNAENDER